MSHPVVWFEVLGADAAKLQRFYADLFGWTINADNPMKYGMVDAVGGRGIPGGVGEQEPKEPPHSGVTVYVETSDIPRSLAQAEALGGSTIMPRTVLPGGTVLAYFKDPSGNAIGLVEQAA